MSYLFWDKKTITDFSNAIINRMYNDGYLFGRPQKGYIYQTRSLRIDLSKFELSSENRRVLRKTEDVELKILDLPYSDYHWSIGKLAKDFYDSKFGKGTFSANKVKELLTTKHNFNKLFTYDDNAYTICLETDELLHYSYPFYNLESNTPNLGMGMMLKAITWAKDNNKEYIYLGSAQRPGDTYKLQFTGIEWFDGKEWQSDLETLKQIL